MLWQGAAVSEALVVVRGHGAAMQEEEGERLNIGGD